MINLNTKYNAVSVVSGIFVTSLSVIKYPITWADCLTLKQRKKKFVNILSYSFINIAFRKRKMTVVSNVSCHVKYTACLSPARRSI
jgi:hypothetical protein